MLKELIASDVEVRLPELSPQWRASEIGRDCETFLCHRQLGHTPLPVQGRIRHMLDDGNAHERDIVNRLEDQGMSVAASCITGQMHVTLNGFISGHPDGIVGIPPSVPRKWDYVDEHFDPTLTFYLLEITAPNHFSFQRIIRDHLKVALHQKYVQIQVYLATPEVRKMSSCCVVEVKNKNTSELYEEGVSFDRDTVDWAIERAKRVDGMVLKKQISSYRCDDWRRNTCIFRHLCFVESEISTPMSAGVLKGETLKEAEELRAAIESWRKGKGLEEAGKEGKELVDEARDYVRSIIEDYGAEGLTFDNVTAKMVAATRRSVDIESLKGFPEAFAACVSVQTSRYVRVV